MPSLERKFISDQICNPAPLPSMELYLLPRETSAPSPFPPVGDKEAVYQTVCSQAIRTPRWDHQSFNCFIQLGRKMSLSLSLFLPVGVVAEVFPVTCWQFRRWMCWSGTGSKQSIQENDRVDVDDATFLYFVFFVYFHQLIISGGGLEIWQERSNPNSKNHWNILLWWRKFPPCFLVW